MLFRNRCFFYFALCLHSRSFWLSLFLSPISFLPSLFLSLSLLISRSPHFPDHSRFSLALFLSISRSLIFLDLLPCLYFNRFLSLSLTRKVHRNPNSACRGEVQDVKIVVSCVLFLSVLHSYPLFPAYSDTIF